MARTLPCGKTYSERGLTAACTDGQTSFISGFGRWTNLDERRNYNGRRGGC